MEQFDSILSSVIDSTLGLRCKSFGYRYSEIIRSLMSIYFCGGSCIEDATTHLMNHLSLHPTLRTCSSDTILRAIKELTQENISYTSDIILLLLKVSCSRLTILSLSHSLSRTLLSKSLHHLTLKLINTLYLLLGEELRVLLVIFPTNVKNLLAHLKTLLNLLFGLSICLYFAFLMMRARS